MSLLKKFSKSTQDLREKKKWRISTLKPRKKEHVRKGGGVTEKHPASILRLIWIEQDKNCSVLILTRTFFSFTWLDTKLKISAR